MVNINPIFGKVVICFRKDGKVYLRRYAVPTGSKTASVQYHLSKVAGENRGRTPQEIRSAVAEELGGMNVGGTTPRPHTAEATMNKIMNRLKGGVIPLSAGRPVGRVPLLEEDERRRRRYEEF